MFGTVTSNVCVAVIASSAASSSTGTSRLQPHAGNARNTEQLCPPAGGARDGCCVGPLLVCDVWRTGYLRLTLRHANGKQQTALLDGGIGHREPDHASVWRAHFGTIVFVEALVFIASLAIAYVYAWRKGVFQWR